MATRMKHHMFDRLLGLTSIAFLPAILVYCAAAASQEQPIASPPIANNGEREITLTLSLELSTEPGNEAALVGRLIHSHWFVAGDQLELNQRFSNLRKEFVAKYARPTQVLGFSFVSHELRLADIQQFITSEKTLRSSTASYRNLFGRQTDFGLFGAGWALEALRLDSEPGQAPYITDYIKREGRTVRVAPLLAYWLHDRRQSNEVLPNGHYDSAALEWGVLTGSNRYTKFDFSHESYWALSRRLSAGFSVSLGYLSSFGGHLSPITKRYFGGGVGSVRGFESGSLGPADASGAIMGANRKVTGTLEALWHAFDIGPTPIIVSVFADHGRFHEAENSTVAGVSANSVGLGVSIPVPIGLVRFSFARPNDETQRIQRFQFDARANWK